LSALLVLAILIGLNSFRTGHHVDSRVSSMLKPEPSCEVAATWASSQTLSGHVSREWITEMDGARDVHDESKVLIHFDVLGADRIDLAMWIGTSWREQDVYRFAGSHEVDPRERLWRPCIDFIHYFNPSQSRRSLAVVDNLERYTQREKVLSEPSVAVWNGGTKVRHDLPMLGIEPWLIQQTERTSCRVSAFLSRGGSSPTSQESKNSRDDLGATDYYKPQRELSNFIVRRVLTFAALSLALAFGVAFIGSGDGYLNRWCGAGLILTGGCSFAATGLYLFGWL